MTAKATHLDRLGQLSSGDLAAVVEVVEQALMLGDGWLQRQPDGTLRARQTTDVVIRERESPVREAPPDAEGEVEVTAPPLYMALDLWMATGRDSREFQPFVDEHGFALTWSLLLDEVRDLPTCWEPLPNRDWCVLNEGHRGPHYGRDDVAAPVDLPPTCRREVKVTEAWERSPDAAREGYLPPLPCPVCSVVDEYCDCDLRALREELEAENAASDRPIVRTPSEEPEDGGYG